MQTQLAAARTSSNRTSGPRRKCSGHHSWRGVARIALDGKDEKSVPAQAIGSILAGGRDAIRGTRITTGGKDAQATSHSTGYVCRARRCSHDDSENCSRASAPA